MCFRIGNQRKTRHNQTIFRGSKTEGYLGRQMNKLLANTPFQTCCQKFRVGNFWFLYLLVLSKWEDLAFSVSRLFEKSVFILQFFNDKMHNYVKQNITKNFNIKKLNNKHTFLKTEKTKFSRWENLAFSVLRKVCLFFNFWIIKHTNALNKT